MAQCSEDSLTRFKHAYETHWGEKFRGKNVDWRTIIGKMQRVEAPKSWKQNSTEWLSNFDIEAAMRRYERHFPDFLFLGVLSSDFLLEKRTGKSGGGLRECIVSELCNTCLPDILKTHSRIGMVLNTDDHLGDGEHWVALFADFRPGIERVVYFDSYSARPDKDMPDVMKLMARWDKQWRVISGHGLELEYNAVRHQMKNSECGMYCIFFLHCCLFEVPMATRIPDDVMNLLRNEIFRVD